MKKLFLIFCGLFFVSFIEAEKDYVLRLKVGLSQLRIPNHVKNLAVEELLGEPKLDASVLDIAQAGNFHQMTKDRYVELLRATGKVRPPNEFYTYDNLQELITFNNAHKNFTEFVTMLFNHLNIQKDNDEKLSKFAEGINKTFLEFLECYFYGDFKFFDKITPANVKSTLESLEVEEDSLWNFVRDFTFAHLNLDKTFAVKQLNSIFNVRELLLLGEYTTSNIQKVPIFRTYIADTQTKFNKINALAIAIHSDRFLINKAAYDDWKEEEDLAFVEATSINSPSSTFTAVKGGVTRRTFNIFELTGTNSNTEMEYVNFTKPTSDLENCTFITFKEGKLVESLIANVSLLFEDTLSFTTDDTNIVVGSPLICDGILHGMAKQLITLNQSLLLDVLYDDEEQEFVPTVPPNSGQGCRPNIMSTFLAFIILLLYSTVL